MDPQHPAHGPDTELSAMRPDEGVLHWGAREGRARHCARTNGAKGAPFFRMSRSSGTLANARFRRRFSAT